jgi:hypothetical protein
MTTLNRREISASKGAAMARLEDAIQEAIVKYLHYVLIDKIIISIPNEGRRSPAMAARLKRMGMRPGAADLLLIWRGRPFFFEVKTAKGTLSAEQITSAKTARRTASPILWCEALMTCAVPCCAWV